MSAELNKMAGWGLSGLMTDDDGQVIDPRVNTDSPLLTGTARLTDFQAALSGVDVVTHADPKLADDEPSRSVVLDREVLIVRPVWLPAWHRVGDHLDRAGELGEPEDGARLEYLPSAMWPYSNLYMDAHTGAELGEEVEAFVRATRSTTFDTLDDAARDDLARATTGFASLAQAQMRVVPGVPSAVRALVTWGRLFTDPSVVHQLRPALYTWWS